MNTIQENYLFYTWSDKSSVQSDNTSFHSILGLDSAIETVKITLFGSITIIRRQDRVTFNPKEPGKLYGLVRNLLKKGTTDPKISLSS